MHPAPVTGFRLTRRVQFYETDAAGIVHFSNYFRYMEEAEHAMWRSVGLTIHDRQGDLGWPRVAAAFDYFRPLRFEDEFDVVLTIVAINPKTIRYTCELMRGETRIGAGSLTIACVRRQADHSVSSTEIPADIAARFSVNA